MRRHSNSLHAMFRACREGGFRELRAAIAQGVNINQLERVEGIKRSEIESAQLGAACSQATARPGTGRL